MHEVAHSGDDKPCPAAATIPVLVSLVASTASAMSRINFTECAAIFAANTTEGQLLRWRYGWNGTLVGIDRSPTTQISREGCLAVCGKRTNGYNVDNFVLAERNEFVPLWSGGIEDDSRSCLTLTLYRKDTVRKHIPGTMSHPPSQHGSCQSWALCFKHLSRVTHSDAPC